MLKARVLTCVEGLNLVLLEQAIQEQREYQRGRDNNGQQDTEASRSTDAPIPEHPPQDTRGP